MRSLTIYTEPDTDHTDHTTPKPDGRRYRNRQPLLDGPARCPSCNVPLVAVMTSRGPGWKCGCKAERRAA